MKLWRLIILTLLLLSNHSITYAEEIRLGTGWTKMYLTQAGCLRQASEVLWLMKFKSTGDDRDEYSIWGNNGEYKAVIRGVASQEIVFFAVAGTNGKTVGEYRDKLVKHFGG
jgi:hypothetical protein